MVVSFLVLNFACRSSGCVLWLCVVVVCWGHFCGCVCDCVCVCVCCECVFVDVFVFVVVV